MWINTVYSCNKYDTKVLYNLFKDRNSQHNMKCLTTHLHDVMYSNIKHKPHIKLFTKRLPGWSSG